MNSHTCTVCGVHLIVAVVGLPHGEFVEVVGEVVCSSGVCVPCLVDRIGGSISLRRRCVSGRSHLSRGTAAIVSHAKELPLEALEALGDNMPQFATQLAQGRLPFPVLPE
jgi:hypothetical protein